MPRLLILFFLTIGLTACIPPEQHVSSKPAVLTSSAAPIIQFTPGPDNCQACGRATEQMTAPIPGTLIFDTTPSLATPTVHAMLTNTVVGDASQVEKDTQICLRDYEICYLDGHFLLLRPIGPGGKQSIERSYPFASTQSGIREPHHGVEFYNQQGTPVLAAADGKVVFAGDDKLVTLAWVPAYYGKVVVLEHHFSGLEPTVYTLYAHQNSLKVKVGQFVQAGEQIGEVGSTGTAIGSHLHFEVRLVYDDYKSVRNPELWLAPLPATGVLAGRIQDAQANLITGTVNIQRILAGVLNPLSVASADTYFIKEPQPVHADDILGENFVAGELPVGEYRLTLVYYGSVYEKVVEIFPGKLTFVKFLIK